MNLFDLKFFDTSLKNYKNIDEKVQIINNYLLTYLQSPLRPFIFNEYNKNYYLLYELFFINSTNKSKIEEITSNIKKYLQYYIINELNDIELVDVKYDENKKILQIIYKLIDNNQYYQININLIENYSKK